MELKDEKSIFIKTGQVWKNKKDGYLIIIDYINRSKDLVFEEMKTRQRNGGCRKWFLNNFEFYSNNTQDIHPIKN